MLLLFVIVAVDPMDAAFRSELAAYYWPMVVGSAFICAVGDRICEIAVEPAFHRLSDSVHMLMLNYECYY